MTSTARVARLRQRRREGVVVLQVAVPAQVIDALVDTGDLEEWDSEDREAQSRAAAAALEQYARAVTRFRLRGAGSLSSEDDADPPKAA